MDSMLASMRSAPRLDIDLAAEATSLKKLLDVQRYPGFRTDAFYRPRRSPAVPEGPCIGSSALASQNYSFVKLGDHNSANSLELPLKRVRKFILKIGVGSSANVSTAALIKPDYTENLDSWHRACEVIAEKLSGDETLQAEVFPQGCHRVIARFAAHNLYDLETSNSHPESEETTEVVTSVWRSVRFPLSENVEIFENRNTLDFHWDLLDGARRDVPFALTRLERSAQRSRIGGYIYSVIQQWKDMFAKPL